MSHTRQYIIDEQGERIGVLLDLEEYQQLTRLTPPDAEILVGLSEAELQALAYSASPFNMVVVGRLIEPSRHGCHSCTLFLPVVSFLDHEDVCGMPRD